MLLSLFLFQAPVAYLSHRICTLQHSSLSLPPVLQLSTTYHVTPIITQNAPDVASLAQSDFVFCSGLCFQACALPFLYDLFPPGDTSDPQSPRDLFLSYMELIAYFPFSYLRAIDCTEWDFIFILLRFHLQFAS